MEKRKLNCYEESKNIESIFPRGYFFQEISGKYASFILYLLQTRFSWTINYLVRNLNTLTSLQTLEIEDEPTDKPIYRTEISEINQNNETPQHLKSLFKKSEWAYSTIADYYSAYMDGKSTPTEVAQKLIKICESDLIKNYRAIVEMKPDEILKNANESTLRYKNKNPLSVVDGVPFFVKEHIHIKNYKTYSGIYENEKLRDDTAFCIQKLIDVGALLIGTVTMPELGANAIGSNASKQFPPPLNPWDNSLYTGGSSSGNAVVIALGLCPFSIGSDALGSIRVPSGWCGIVGIRPTFSRVSNRGAIEKNTNAFSVIGPMACCSNDAAIVLQIIGGKDEKWEDTINQPSLQIPNFDAFSIKSIKFGFYDNFNKYADPFLYESFNKFCAFLKDQECVVEDIVIPEIVEIHTASIIGLLNNKWKQINELCERIGICQPPGISLNLIKILSELISSQEIDNANKQRTRSIKILEEIFKKVDVILFLTSSIFPCPQRDYHQISGYFEEATYKSSLIYSSLSALSGTPSLSINIGYHEESGLPISLQILTKWWREDSLFSIANFIENNFPLRKPKDFQNILN